MDKTIRQILLKEKDNLEDEILSCLTNLNMYDMLTPDELGMTDEAINADKKKEAVYIDKYVSLKEKIEHWLNVLDDKNEEEYIEQIFKELPFIQERYIRVTNQELR